MIHFLVKKQTHLVLFFPGLIYLFESVVFFLGMMLKIHLGLPGLGRPKPNKSQNSFNPIPETVKPCERKQRKALKPPKPPSPISPHSLAHNLSLLLGSLLFRPSNGFSGSEKP